MTTSAKQWLNELLISPDDDYAGHRHWDFTIYRTGYGPGASSDQQWQRLLKLIQTSAHEEAFDAIESEEQDPKDDPDFQKLWSLFHLDACSDPSLAGLDMDQLRQLYNSGEGGQPMKANFKSHRIFLFDDYEVLSGVDSIVKCVDAGYRAEDYLPRHTRGQLYAGWMRMNARSIANFWIELGLHYMCDTAPPVIGGIQLVNWGHDVSCC